MIWIALSLLVLAGLLGVIGFKGLASGFTTMAKVLSVVIAALAVILFLAV